MTLPPQERYLAKPYLGSSHSWAQLQLAGVSQTARVLDVGAGQGVMGAFLCTLGIQQLTALEIDPQARVQLATHYTQVVSSTAELSPDQRFDAILLLDVLEHVAQPEEFFAQLLRFAAPGALILISVPNIAHWSVRIPLLFGRFEYYSRGILDRTHLQFLSRRRIQRMLAGNHCQLLQFDSTTEPLEFLLPEWLYRSSPYHFCALLRLALARVLPGLFSYQHVCSARLRAPKD
jgi:2-polyprenyl-3-methyl-5-hydroxy-6-metoxy-1,4-benzoquinol methylase